MFFINGVNPSYEPFFARNFNFKHVSVIAKKFRVIEELF